jgi:YHS domain-containing protein
MKHDLMRRRAFALATLFATATVIGLSPAVAQAVGLAIKGYDPVAYFTDGKPVHGVPEFAYDWDEHRYYFASAQHRDLFKADPVHYAPQFGNYCAMALSQGGIVVANPEYWQIDDGKLYIFGESFGPKLFRKDLATNIAKDNANRRLLPKD